TNRGKVRRAKLHYLRERVGKRALLVKSAGRN
ncbi:50S ribosomal protein L19, partial [bacterium]|nr:50S ribosomal protein L19 [bacterium]